MEVIYQKRQTGKTTKLIKLSAEHFYCIVCHSPMEAKRIAHLAKSMGLDIPFPLTYSEFLNKNYSAQNVKGLLIDDAYALLSTVAESCEIKAITINETE